MVDTKSKTIDFAHLRKSLDDDIMKRNINTAGLCPERHQLYKDCFDEIILKVTSLDPEQGVILSRIRDELNMTSESYKKLYESSVSFGLNKAITARQQNEKLHAKIDDVLREKVALMNENEYLKRKLKAIEQGDEDATKRDEEMSRYMIELQRLKSRNEKIKRGLEHVLLNGSEQVSNILMLHTTTN
jgi:dynein light intermediate chain